MVESCSACLLDCLFLISLSSWSFVFLFLYFKGSLVYFLCTSVAPLWAFNEFQLLIKKKEKEKEKTIQFVY
jgi:hypothetical protein